MLPKRLQLITTKSANCIDGDDKKMPLTVCNYSKPSINTTVNPGIIIKLPGKLNIVINKQDSKTDGEQLLLTGN